MNGLVRFVGSRAASFEKCREGDSQPRRRNRLVEDSAGRHAAFGLTQRCIAGDDRSGDRVPEMALDGFNELDASFAIAEARIRKDGVGRASSERGQREIDRLGRGHAAAPPLQEIAHRCKDL